MPKTTLFETELAIVKEYIHNGMDSDSDNDSETSERDKDTYIKPGMTFMMNYTHTKNYASEDATVQVTVISVRRTIEDYYGRITVIGCVLKPETTIYVCEAGAYLARGITLHNETTTIAKGCVQKILA